MLYVFYDEKDKNQYAKGCMSQLEQSAVTDVKVVPAHTLFAYKNALLHFCNRVAFILHLPFPFIFTKKLRDIFRQIKGTDSVLIFAIPCLTMPICFQFCRLCRSKSKFIWTWDAMTEDVSRHMSYCKKYFKAFSFDRDDCKKYGLNYKNTVSFKPVIPDKKSDVYFVGLSRGRYGILNSIYESFSGLGIDCNFVVLNDDSSIPKTLPFSTKRVNEPENIMNIVNSKAVLDIPIQRQSGLTQRTLEAMLLGRKLITTNTAIKKEEFYTKQNVFIFGEDDITGLKSFLNSDFEKMPEGIVKKYLIDDWIKEFL